MFQLQRLGSHGSIMPRIKSVKRLRDARGVCFVAQRVCNYNEGRGMGYHLFRAKQMHSRREKV